MPIDEGAAVPVRQFLNLPIADLDLDQVVNWCRTRSSAPGFAYVVTPNVDHVVQLYAQPHSPVTHAFRTAYLSADLCICDSRILSLFARRCGFTLPVVPGSDLTAALFEKVFTHGHRVVVVGGRDDTISRLKRAFPGPEYIQHLPPFGLARDEPAQDRVADFVAEANADFILFIVGAPQSEIIASKCRARGARRGVAFCVGASIDFLLGDRPRAPRWVQRLHLEWAHRLASEPGRLWRRYLVEGPRVFRIVKQWRSGTLEPFDLPS